jgi:hypothetical protein
MPIVGRNVNVADVNKVLEAAAKHIMDAKGNDPVVSRKDIKAKLDTLSGEEKALVDMFYRFTDHRDSKPGARITQKDVDATLAYAKRKLVERLDHSGDGALSNDEIAGMSRIGKLAVAIAQHQQNPVTPPPNPTQGYSANVNKAIDEGLLEIKKSGNNITGVRVTSDWDSTLKPSELAKEVLGLGADALTEFTVGNISQWDSDDSYQACIDELAKHGPMNKLKDVFIGDFSQDENEISWVDIGDVSKLYAAAPNMEDLHVKGGGINLGTLKHDNLKSLFLESGGLPGEAVKSLSAADLPKLEKLEVWFGADEYGSSGKPADLDGLLTGDGMPNLKHLGLQNSEFQNEIAQKLAGSKILAQLESVDLSMGTMDDTGAQALLDNKDAFKHLKSINLDENYLSPGMITKLQAEFGSAVTIGDQSKFDDIDPSDPSWRYVSVGE